MFLFHSDLFTYQIVKMAIPGIKTDTTRFRDFRDYGKKLFRTLKHEFLYVNLYQRVRMLMKENLTAMSYRSDNAVERKKLADFIVSRWDITIFKEVFGYIFKYIDYDATFDDRTSLPWFYLKNIYCQMAIAIRDLIHREEQLPANIGKQWHSTGKNIWTTDLNFRRNYVDKLFFALGGKREFDGVTETIFTWIYPEQQRTSKKRRQLDMSIDEALPFDEEPPPPALPASKTRKNPYFGGHRQQSTIITIESPCGGHHRPSIGTTHSPRDSHHRPSIGTTHSPRDGHHRPSISAADSPRGGHHRPSIGTMDSFRDGCRQPGFSSIEDSPGILPITPQAGRRGTSHSSQAGP
jgi:hypothetical protein